MSMISIGANFVTLYDEDSGVYLTFKCKETVVLDDRVVEMAKKYAKEFIECSDITSLYSLYDNGWFLFSIE